MSSESRTSYLIQSGTLVQLDPIEVTRCDLRIDAGRIVERDAAILPLPEDEVIDARGKLVLPGMVCAHTHLYSALARGMPAPARTPRNFREILELIWWRLDRALDEETIYWSAIAGALDAVRAGTTCLFDHHASPNHIPGSLSLIRDALETVGLRGVLCYEVTDRGDAGQRDAGLQENQSFADKVNADAGRPGTTDPQFRALVGAHASFTLSDESLAACAAIMKDAGIGLHIHAAEDLSDVEHARDNYKLGVIERLARLGALNDKTILAHGVHLSAAELAIARDAGVWLAHNPRSNMNNQVGYAPVEEFGSKMVLGTDGIGADMFDEARFAFFKGRDAGAGLGADDWLRVLSNNQRLASETFGVQMGTLNRGSAADLVIIDYKSPTPVTSENLPWHLAFGLTSAAIESVTVAGRFLIRDRQAAYPEAELYEKALKASRKLWKKLEDIG
jgi:putative selenium metabolism protein SsnA